MELKELMIGDYVRCITDNTYHKIEAISSLGAMETSWQPYYRSDGGKYNLLTDVVGIPITPEILLENGFTKTERDGDEAYELHERFGDGYTEVVLYDHLDGEWGLKALGYNRFRDAKNIFTIQNDFIKVHQLQQAFRLCGIGKKIIV